MKTDNASAQLKLFQIFDSFEQQFTCPITQMRMKDPVLTEDGHSYEKAAIYKWLINSQKSPQTGLPLTSKKLLPNINLKYLIERFDKLKRQILGQKITFMEGLDSFLSKQTTGIKDVVSKIPWQSQISGNKMKENGEEQNMGEHSSKQSYCKSDYNLQKCQQKMIKEAISQINGSIRKYQENIYKQYPVLFNILDKISDKDHPGLTQLNNRLGPRQNLLNHQKNQHNLKKLQQPNPNDIIQNWIKDTRLNQYSNQDDKNLFQKTLRQPYEYLLHKFNFQEEEISDRYRKDKYSHEIGLWHNQLQIDDMKDFVKYDWNVLQYLNVTQCQIGDDAWKTMIENAKGTFYQLNTVWIYGNLITLVKETDLNEFVKLKTIQFWHYNGMTNPLLQKSKASLRKYKLKNPNVFIEFPQ